jgi:hypothetical protein
MPARRERRPGALPEADVDDAERGLDVPDDPGHDIGCHHRVDRRGDEPRLSHGEHQQHGLD